MNLLSLTFLLFFSYLLLLFSPCQGMPLLFEALKIISTLAEVDSQADRVVVWGAAVGVILLLVIALLVIVGLTCALGLALSSVIWCYLQYGCCCERLINAYFGHLLEGESSSEDDNSSGEGQGGKAKRETAEEKINQFFQPVFDKLKEHNLWWSWRGEEDDKEEEEAEKAVMNIKEEEGADGSQSNKKEKEKTDDKQKDKMEGEEVLPAVSEADEKVGNGESEVEANEEVKPEQVEEVIVEASGKEEVPQEEVQEEESKVETPQEEVQKEEKVEEEEKKKPKVAGKKRAQKKEHNADKKKQVKSDKSKSDSKSSSNSSKKRRKKEKSKKAGNSSSSTDKNLQP